jgi:hypothetical protein
VKYSLAIVALIGLLPLNSRADSEFDIAVKGGAVGATLEHDNREIRYGFSGGLAGFLQRPLSDRLFLSVQFDLLYTARGAEAVFDGVNMGESRSHHADLRVSARPGTRLGPADVYLLLGGGPSFLVSANKTILGKFSHITGDLYRIDVELLMGAGLALHLRQQDLGPLHLGSVFLEARHDIGLLDTDAVNGGFKNRSSSLLLGLSFAVSGSAAAVHRQ